MTEPDCPDTSTQDCNTRGLLLLGDSTPTSCSGGHGPRTLPLDLDATVLSDEHADEFHDGQLRVLGFTGAMLGPWAQDLDGSGVHAGFGYATYRTEDQ
ncbi:hypothetical protein ACFYR1_27390 [Streptomyces canus]|uniref:beta-xylosidase family glycoside hydrolase n=1 Tax=Streptomyces canus TaxID=58343 RepID=UPI0036A169EA